MTTLVVTVNTAVLVKSTDFFGDMENYVVLRLTANGNTYQEVKTTNTKGKKEQPIVWNQSFNFPISNDIRRSARLQVFVMDEDMTSDDSCGQGMANIQNCQMFSRAKQSYKLRLYDSKFVQIQGQLNFTTELR